MDSSGDHVRNVEACIDRFLQERDDRYLMDAKALLRDARADTGAVISEIQAALPSILDNLERDGAAMTGAVIQDVPLTPQDEAMMLLTGFAYRADDGILTLTEKGNDWLHEWCQRKIAEASDA